MTNVQTPAEVAQPAPPQPPQPAGDDLLPSRIGPKSAPAAQLSAAAAGQPALTRIARTNMLRAISRECFAVDRDALPAPLSVTFDPVKHSVSLQFDTSAELIIWAERHGAASTVRETHREAIDGTRYRIFTAAATWRGFALELVAGEWTAAAAA